MSLNRPDNIGASWLYKNNHPTLLSLRSMSVYSSLLTDDCYWLPFEMLLMMMTALFSLSLIWIFKFHSVSTWNLVQFFKLLIFQTLNQYFSWRLQQNHKLHMSLLVQNPFGVHGNHNPSQEIAYSHIMSNSVRIFSVLCFQLTTQASKSPHKQANQYQFPFVTIWYQPERQCINL